MIGEAMSLKKIQKLLKVSGVVILLLFEVFFELFQRLAHATISTLWLALKPRV